MTGATYLDEILAAHRSAATADRRDVDALVAEARATGAPRGFTEALRRADGLAVIGEIKRRSPSRGELDRNLEPTAVAREYETGGATCLSVLSDAAFFGGSAQDVTEARRACLLPVLRKDFTLALARALGLDALVEAHDEDEVERALAAGADLIGVNQRDLTTFAVDHDRALRVVAAIPGDVVAVAESGIRHGDDARRLADAGYRAILVGETLMKASDRREALGALVGHRVGRRVQPGGVGG
jgi:indole-3-glycerol phosphate synthase